MARYLEILCNMISIQASGSAPRRPWRWEDFGEGKLKLPSGAEIRKFISPPGNPDRKAPLVADDRSEHFKRIVALAGKAKTLVELNGDTAPVVARYARIMLPSWPLWVAVSIQAARKGLMRSAPLFPA